ncbi:MAG: ectoine hydroxylase [Kofleriaceae bacterium]
MARAEHDPYYSRVGGGWELAERVDPVVWGREPGPLDEDEVDRYERQGFLVQRSLLSPEEVGALLAEAHELAAAADPGADDVITEPGGDAIRSLFRVHVISATMRRLAADRRLAGVARQLLGEDVYIHQSRINFKPAFEGKAFPWHSDFETWHVEDGMPRMRALSASLLLSDNSEHNGPLMIVPGSHRRYVRCAGETPPEHFRQSLRKQAYGVPDREALTRLVADGGLSSVTGPAGTVVFFDCNVMHGSSANITPSPRHNVFMCFNAVSNRLVEPFAGTAPRPGFLAERERHALHL